MIEGFKRAVRGAMFGAGIAASGEAMAGAPHGEDRPLHAEHHETANTAWADAAEAQFKRDMAVHDHDGMAEDVRAFVREYNFPTKGNVKISGQGNAMRVATRSEWQHIADIGTSMLESSKMWGHPMIRASLIDVLQRNDEHIHLTNKRDTLRYSEHHRLQRGK